MKGLATTAAASTKIAVVWMFIGSVADERWRGIAHPLLCSDDLDRPLDPVGFPVAALGGEVLGTSAPALAVGGAGSFWRPDLFGCDPLEEGPATC